jgi:two-component system, cell cycle sensor histidine kinase and response regulator CckA
MPNGSAPRAPVSLPPEADAELMASITDGTSDLLWVVDSKTFDLLWWNRSVAEFLGAGGLTLQVGQSSDGGEASGMRSGDLRAFYEHAAADGAFQVEAQLGRRVRLSLDFTRLDRDGNAYAILAVARDVTEKHRAHEQLLQAEAKYRTVVDTMREGLVVISGDSVLYLNQMGCETLGGTLEQFVSRPFSEHVHPDDREAVMAAVSRVFGTGEPIMGHEFRVVTQTGGCEWVSARASLLDWEGRPAVVGLLDKITERKRAAQMLEESERRYRTVVDNIQEGVIVASADEKLYFNGRMAEMLGYTGEEYAGLSLASRVHPRDAVAVTRRRSESFETGTPVSDFDCRLVDKEGRVLWVRCKSSLIDWAGRRAAITFVEDVTAQVQAETALRESADIITTMFKSVQDPFYLVTLDEGRLLEFNHALEELIGCTREEVIGRTIAELGLWNDSEQRLRMVEELRTKGQVRDFELMCRSTTGELVPCSVSSTVCDIGGKKCSVGFIRDQTERKAAERALREQQEQLNRFFSLDVGLLSISDLDGYFRMLSAGWENLLGYSTEELMSRPFFDFLHPDDVAPAREAGERLRAGGQVADSLSRYRYRAADGSYRTLAWRSAPAGDLAYSAAQDITDMLAAEDRLRQSQKMEAVGQLAGGIAHDFNNLLTAILGYTDLLLGSPEAQVEQLRLDLMEIKGAAKRAADLTQQILAFSRKQALRPEVLCVNSVLKELSPLLERLIGESIVLEVKADESLGHCEIDPGQFTQVLINLAVNARDAMPQGGFLVLETANVEVQPQDVAAHSGVPSGRYVVLKCADTGMGMDPSTSSHIFEPFFTTKRAGQGTGLGLSTVHGIVHQSGGTVLVDSEVGKGSVFTIYLPRIFGSAPERGRSEKQVPAERGHGNILVVEDEEAVGALARRVLAAQGYTVATASTAAQAMTFLSDPTRSLDLLITDMVLPGGMQGGALADTASGLRPDLAIIFMSGYSQDSNIHGGRLDERVNFLQKPFSANGLIAKVEDALARLGGPAGAPPGGLSGKEF